MPTNIKADNVIMAASIEFQTSVKDGIEYMVFVDKEGKRHAVIMQLGTQLMIEDIVKTTYDKLKKKGVSIEKKTEVKAPGSKADKSVTIQH